MQKKHCITLPYAATGAFSALVIDYLEQNEKLRPFLAHLPNLDGIKSAIAARSNFETPRQMLHKVLTHQYQGYYLHPKQQMHLDALLENHTFTIVTAHQPNLFTGPLYFIYKILHAIKLADELSLQMPQYHFVPIYYMGSEDADLDELGNFTAAGTTYTWKTDQIGAVGRMKTEGIAELIELIKERFGFLPYGQKMITLLEDAYLRNNRIQEATLKLVHELFADFGLLVIIPDNPELKRAYLPVMERELTTRFSQKTVVQTTAQLSQHYKVQAAGREINLFYLFDDGRRERIELVGNKYRVLFSDLYFSEAELLTELHNHPERFSPNVILRGMFQETILPNVVFIGGGAEIAYWLELKQLFEEAKVPYPVLVLRNSFMLIDEKSEQLIHKLGLAEEELFLPQMELEDLLVKRRHGQLRETTEAQQQLQKVYAALRQEAAAVDKTLVPHVGALEAKALKGLVALAGKMQRAERRSIAEEARQIEQLKQRLFPKGVLQERIENFLPLYAVFGPDLLMHLYKHSLGLQQQFTCLYLSTLSPLAAQ
jgi:bacillithiol biosynthesis cysteine-adding enzyme BshC